MSELKAAAIQNIDGALVRAKAHLEAGKFDDAERLFLGIRERRPQRWEGHMGMAQVSLQGGRISECMQCLSEAIQVAPDCLPAYQLMAHLGIDGGLSDTALQWLEFGAGHLPAETVIFEWLVLLYAMENRLEDLVQCLAHYGRLRGISTEEAALIFTRQPQLEQDLRSRIAQAADF
jgi:tetratricopeptide (TPR) repeat protein